ncbi:malonyl CoA-ACP transacylase [Amycolatopsis sp. WAC 04182]|uniref:type I polyketide synthase n=1 Tax=Amycolatopsis sp. WAC 04182 TaxID=2203198 RepID=UPI000F76B09F|nr:type I polyketide synthase [Amycolatopsis sp. WAC 04182]RSN55080.1 malonyl CoA-ACP transacylase [Amycolatopsis sp. WAC 04182]
MTDQRHQPIAIVGMDCRFPGGVETPEDYWRLLDSGRHFSTSLPTDRGWDLAWLCDPNAKATGETVVRQGSFFADVSTFDAGLFRVSPREATLMDPQQRLLLESTWRAIERARIPADSLSGTRTGVYVGLRHSNYHSVGTPPQAGSGAEADLLTGDAMSVASGRLSYLLNLSGPALSADTACSSGLVALHLAVRALRTGECDMAIAAAVCVLSTPDLLVEFGRAGALTSDGRCKPFAAEADGFTPGEGVVAVVLMPLDRALETGRPVWAVVRGTAVNHDGTGAGLTVPSGAAQRALIADALADAALRPDQVDLVEAHGTGTRVGDPIEAQSIQAAYGTRDPASPVWLGSVKSNLGHTQEAAGLAGVAKIVMAFAGERMPATLHVANPTPEVDWSTGNVRLLREARDWPRGDRVRRAGVLAYGISGTNAHVLLEEPPEPPPRRVRPAANRSGPKLWPLSAASVPSLRGQAAAMAGWVRDRPDADPGDIGWSLATTRASLPERAVVVGATVEALLAGLDTLADTGTLSEEAGARARADFSAQPVFVFPGQGPQWAGMGAALWDESPVFAEALRRCSHALGQWLDFDVVDVVRGVSGTPSLEESEVVQPALFAMYVSLAELWRSHGVRPAAVIGHSQGEIAAAYVAGALTLPEAAQVVVGRCRALRKVTRDGAMAALGLSEERARALIDRWRGRLDVAAVNGPAATTAAGDTAAVDELLRHCEAEGIWCRKVPVDYASHCFHMEAVRDEFPVLLAGLRPTAPVIPMFSTLTGRGVGGAVLDADHWYRGIRQPVLFEQAVRRAMGQGYRRFVEVSPHPVLAGSVRDIAADLGVDALAVPTLRRGRGGFAGVLAGAHVAGIEVDWSRQYPDAVEVDLPTYSFDHNRYWIPGMSRSRDLSSAGVREVRHPWLAVSTDLPGGVTVRTGHLSSTAQPWLADHSVFGSAMLPATGMLELMLHGIAGTGAGRLEDVVLHSPLALTESGADIQVHTDPPGDNSRRPVRLYSRARLPGASWIHHADAVVTESDDAEPVYAVEWPPADAVPVDAEERYRELAGKGYLYGAAFRNMTAAWRTDGRISHLEAAVDPRPTDQGFSVHPALLDAALHGVPLDGDGRRILLPCAIDSVTVHSRGATTLRAVITGDSDRVDLRATDASDKPVVDIRGLRLRPTTARALRATRTAGDAITFDTAWRAVEPATPPPGRWTAVSRCDDLPVDANHDSMAKLIATLPAAGPMPDVVVLDCRERPRADQGTETGRLRERLHRVLADTQAFLAEARLGRSRLVLLTRRAQSTAFGEPVDDVSGAACAGLLRSVHKEYTDRVRVVDLDDDVPDLAVLAAAASAGGPDAAVRDGRCLVPRLVRSSDEALELPAGDTPWRLAPGSSGTFEDVSADVAQDLRIPVGEGRVRLRVEATGVNFRDTMICLGLIESDRIGWEVAGTVVATGPGVAAPRAGDRVVAFAGDGGGFASMADLDHEHVFPMPRGWNSAQAAGITIPFVTAYHALHVLGRVRPGEKVLVHAAAGGVGTAAVQLLRAWGADVYATAGTAKHPTVVDLGVPPGHIADSRSPSFEPRLLDATGGTGFDVVLGSLTGEFVDASLRLLRPGGRYLELGLRDVRDPEEVAARYPGATYHAFNLVEEPAGTFRRAFDALLPMFEDGTVRPSPVRRWGVRQARQVLRRLGQGHTTGKAVLTPPCELDPEGTVLITGGTGTLGGLLAVHLATAHRVRHLLLVSRHGEQAPGATRLRKRLAAIGASVTVTACDVADRDALATVLAGVPEGHPLTAVVHAAGILDDGLVADLTPERLDTVLRSKVDSAVNLHDLTSDLDLRAFVLYSSVIGLVGSPGQAAYSAANAYLDALAHHRCRLGLPAVSVAWGYWQEDSALTARMGRADRARAARQGFLPVPTSQALSAFDTALELGRPSVAVTALGVLDDQSSDLFADLPHRPAGSDREAGDGERAALLARPAGQRLDAITSLVRRHAAAVLGHPGPEDVPHDQLFRRAGFDSLSTVELRTRVAAATGTTLAATALLDHPTPVALARHVDTLLDGSMVDGSVDDGDDGTDAAQSFVTDVLTIWRDGDARRARLMLDEAARDRAAGDLPRPTWHRLTTAPAPLRLLCVPPIIASDAVSPYATLADGLEGSCEVWTTRLPGSVEGEPVPRSLDELAEAWANSVPDGEMCLLGHSSGGLPACHLAEALRRRGREVRGLVLLDAATPSTLPERVARTVIDRLVQASATVSLAALTALRRYELLLDAEGDTRSEVPVLFLHPHDSRLHELWSGRLEVWEVSGTHLSMLEEHAAETVRSIRDWLDLPDVNMRTPRSLSQEGQLLPSTVRADP